MSKIGTLTFVGLFCFYTCSSANAVTEFDVGDYTPTLDKLSMSPVSFYDGFDFTELTNPTDISACGTTYRCFDTRELRGGVYENVTYKYERINKPTPPSFVATRTNVTSAGPIANHYIGINSTVNGGAIYNATTGLGSITGDFIANNIQMASGNAYGGAVCSATGSVVTGNITGDFINNYIKTSNGLGYGGAMSTNGTTHGDIIGNYIGNYIDSSGQAYGGAIHSGGTLNGSIKGDFIANYINSSSSVSVITGGGAINSTGTINGGIEGNFINNYIISSSSGISRGGAVNNTGTINGGIEGNFINNSITATNARGGAIFNIGTITGNIVGVFINNYVDTNTAFTGGGAIKNEGTIQGGIEGLFIGNQSKSTSARINGGAISTQGSVNHVHADFFNNSVISTTGDVLAGAVLIERHMNLGHADSIKGDFSDNKAYTGSGSSFGGALLVFRNTINNIKANFFNNVSESGSGNAEGGAIHMYTLSGTMAQAKDIDGDFTNNQAISNTGNAYGGAIFQDGLITGKIEGIFDGNSAVSTSQDAKGGAIHMTNYGSIGINNILNSSFVDNYAKTSLNTHHAVGGAISSGKNLTFTADGLESKFSGNYTEDKRGKIYNAIFIESTPVRTITFNTINNGYFTINDQIETAKSSSSAGIDYDVAHNIDLTGDGSGWVGINAELVNIGKMTVDNTTLKLGSFNHGDTTAVNDISHGVFVNPTASKPTLELKNGSTLELNYSSYKTLDLGSIVSIGSNNYLSFGANFQTQNSDMINASTATGDINLKSINLSGTVTVGDRIQLFGDDYLEFLNLGTLGSFRLIYNNMDYVLEQDSTDKKYIKVIAEDGLTDQYVWYVPNSNTLNVASTNLDGVSTKGILVNDGVSTITDSNFENIVNNGNEYSTNGDGGVIKNNAGAELTVVDSNFIANTANGNGGAIYNDQGEAIISGADFTGNSANEAGGAIYNTDGDVVIGDSTFLNNTAVDDGGAIYNDGGNLTVVGADFTGNTSNGDGGAVYNTGGTVVITNADFTGNSAVGNGGAIYTDDSLTINAHGYNSVFSGNTANSVANDVYVAAGGELNLDVKNGSISFNSGIDGDVAGYDINITGNAAGTVNINSAVSNVDNVSVTNATLKLADTTYLNGINLDLVGGSLDIANGLTTTMNIKDLSSTNGYINLDVDPVSNVSDLFQISGDLSGTVRLILNVLTDVAPTAPIKFAETPNDDATTQGDFEVFRVIGSSFRWDTEYDDVLQEWYLMLANNIELTPEVTAYAALHGAGIEQTRNMISNVKAKIASNKVACVRCGVYDRSYDGKPLNNTWVSSVHYNSRNKSHVDMEGNIWGLEAGHDLQYDASNKLGVFLSYRKGSYDIDARNSKYYSSINSEIRIDSHIGGLYYRHDANNHWIFASVYGGIQRAEIKTDDGVKAKADGWQMGASIETGYVHQINKQWFIEPSVGVSYTQVNFDDVKDDYGKTAKYDTISHTELEAGAKLQRSFDIGDSKGSLYLKPSIIQTIASNDEVRVTNIDPLKTHDDALLWRAEIGGQYSVTNDLSVHTFVNYTQGSNYEATSMGLGLSYSW